MRKCRFLAACFGLLLIFVFVYRFAPRLSRLLPFHNLAFANGSSTYDNSAALEAEDARIDGLNSTNLLSENEHFVTITDGSTKKVVRTDAATVGELLTRLDLTLTAGDHVSPEPEAQLNANNFFVNIYRSHPILIENDNQRFIANVSTYDPLSALRSAGLTVFDDDRIELIANDTFLENGISLVYKLVRGTGTTIVEEDDLPFETETIRDYNLSTGTEEVRVYGELGKVRRTYQAQTLNGEVVSKELISETVVREPVNRVVAVGTSIKNAKPLTSAMGRNRYTAKNLDGFYVERQETYYDLPMAGVMGFCGQSSYSVRSDGVKIDPDGYILVAASLSRYPRCSVVETSLGLGKVYDTGTFALTNPEQFDIATDWTNRDGR